VTDLSQTQGHPPPGVDTARAGGIRIADDARPREPAGIGHLRGEFITQDLGDDALERQRIRDGETAEVHVGEDVVARKLLIRKIPLAIVAADGFDPRRNGIGPRGVTDEHYVLQRDRGVVVHRLDVVLDLAVRGPGLGERGQTRRRALARSPLQQGKEEVDDRGVVRADDEIRTGRDGPRAPGRRIADHQIPVETIEAGGNRRGGGLPGWRLPTVHEIDIHAHPSGDGQNLPLGVVPERAEGEVCHPQIPKSRRLAHLGEAERTGTVASADGEVAGDGAAGLEIVGGGHQAAAGHARLLERNGLDLDGRSLGNGQQSAVDREDGLARLSDEGTSRNGDPLELGPTDRNRLRHPFVQLEFQKETAIVRFDDLDPGRGDRSGLGRNRPVSLA
jgi:hypothetical protein